MLKFLLPVTLCLLISTAAQSQVVDTILFENFQEDHFPDWATYPAGDDQTWVNFDEDGLEPYDFNDEHRAWYWSDFFYNAEDTITGEINYCAASLSYMDGFLHGNRNWLITPPIHISNDQFTLHWKSAPFQLPRYMDGYLVLAAEGSNDIFSDAFRDTLFQAASMEDIVGDGSSVLLENYTFTPGYIHADSLRNDEYVDYWAPGDSSLLHGILEPHSVSLAQYAGKDIYLAFLHNSDDDYYFAIDDILVQKSNSSGVHNLNNTDFRFVTYPNPVATQLNVLYRLATQATVSLVVYDIQGKMILEIPAKAQQEGEHQVNLNLSRLTQGSYTLSLKIGEQVLSKIFVKK